MSVFANIRIKLSQSQPKHFASVKAQFIIQQYKSATQEAVLQGTSAWLIKITINKHRFTVDKTSII